MDQYTVSGICGAATAATVDLAICNLWNPSTTLPIYVNQVHYVKFTATGINVPRLSHTTTIGTPATTVTPTITNEHDTSLAPPSTVALGLGLYSVEPTKVSALREHSWIVPAAVGSGVMWVFEKPLMVKAGTGLCICSGTAVASDVGAVVAFTWME
jgi:hypothetical protein